MATKTRHNDIIIKRNENGKRYYKTILYPEISYSEMDIYIQGKSTDRLDLLAYQYYGDVNKWWIIAHANKIKGSLNINKNMQIRIPMNLDKILADYKKINSR